MSGRPAVILVAVLLAGGCASSLISSPETESEELAEIKERILELQRTATMARVEIDQLRRQVAALEARLDESAQPEPEPVAAIAPPPLPAADSAPPSIEVSDLEPEPTPPPPPSASATTARPVSEAAQTLYDRGYTLYHQGRYVDAETVFRQFLQAHPDTSLSDNAQYWIGESRFARGDWEAALAAFQETIERYPEGNKLADSLLKAADCWRRLGEEESARSAYDEVIRRFPGSAAAAAAAERRNSPRR